MNLRRIIRRHDSHRWQEPWADHRLRPSIALLLSVCFHAFILSLNFGEPGMGLPGLALPWLERRIQASDITVRLTNVPQPSVPDTTPPPIPPRIQDFTPTSIPPKPAKPLPANKSFEVSPPQDALARRPQKPPVLPLNKTDAPVPAAGTPVPGQLTRPPRPEILVQKDPQQETFNVPPVSRTEPGQLRTPDSAERTPSDGPPAADETEAARKQAEEMAAKLLVEQAALQQNLIDAQELEAKKEGEALRLREVQTQQEAQRQALELEAQRRAEEIARSAAEEQELQAALALQKAQEVKRLEEAKRIEETQKQNEAKKKEEEAKYIAALEMEALKRSEEAARQQAAERQKALESQRQAEAAAAQVRAREIAERQRLEGEAAARRESLAAEQAAGRAAAGTGSGSRPADASPAPGALSGRDLAAAALDQLRSQGTARTAPPLPPSQPRPDDNPRRRSIFGAERDVMLRMYVDSWRWRIERNGALNYSPSAGWRARDYPVVTVAIRSDGSLESVLIHRSSGLREIDEAVQRIVRLYAPYSAFQPALARQFDVIEIRRVWNFDGPLRILEEPQ